MTGRWISLSSCRGGKRRGARGRRARLRRRLLHGSERRKRPQSERLRILRGRRRSDLRGQRSRLRLAGRSWLLRRRRRLRVSRPRRRRRLPRRRLARRKNLRRRPDGRPRANVNAKKSWPPSGRKRRSVPHVTRSTRPRSWRPRRRYRRRSRARPRKRQRRWQPTRPSRQQRMRVVRQRRKPPQRSCAKRPRRRKPIATCLPRWRRRQLRLGGRGRTPWFVRSLRSSTRTAAASSSSAKWATCWTGLGYAWMMTRWRSA